MHLRFRGELARRLACADYVRAYDDARKRQAFFEQYPTLLGALEEVVGLDGEYGREDGADVDAFLRAMFDEDRDRPHPVWKTALTVAFFPAIQSLALRLQSSAHDDDGKRDVALFAWCEAITRVARVSSRDRLAMRLVQAMERRAFRAVRLVCRERALLRDLVTVAMDTGAMEPFAQGRREAVDHVGEMLVEIRESTREAHDGDDHQLAKALDAACTLRERVRLLFPDLPAHDREQIYQRVKKRQTRALTRVKFAAHFAQRVAADVDHQKPKPSLEGGRKEAAR